MKNAVYVTPQSPTGRLSPSKPEIQRINSTKSLPCNSGDFPSLEVLRNGVLPMMDFSALEARILQR